MSLGGAINTISFLHSLRKNGAPPNPNFSKSRRMILSTLRCEWRNWVSEQGISLDILKSNTWVILRDKLRRPSRHVAFIIKGRSPERFSLRALISSELTSAVTENRRPLYEWVPSLMATA